MLISEALAERAEANNRLSQLKGRLATVARVQEGDAPDENPQALLDEAERLLARIEELVRRINLTNAQVMVGEMTMTEALAQRDHLLAKRRLLTEFADRAAARQDRYTVSEVKYVATVDIRALRSRADEASKRYRELDLLIQQVNWSTQLL
ncbi:DIP1984 family protein [Corynebacterium breve]|uniref:DIP1984 family protein n=1 Tax=Corynebacterium breve TaxID=3049799 RepID=A0ABY8VD21_9CORY|nr:DIP1984 family protein [Corynebacterium breve]WIM67554.1 DIP1984 family protein [Corynebacterium breve]